MQSGFIFCAVLVTVLLAVCTSAGASTAAWSSYLHDPQNTLATSLKGPTKTPSIKWRTNLTRNAFASASLASDGTSFISDGDVLMAFDNSGKKVWSVTTTNFVSHPVLIEEDGLLLITSDRGLYVFNPKNGKPIRNVTLSTSSLVISGSSLVVDEKAGRAYFTVQDFQGQNGGFYCVDYTQTTSNPIIWNTVDMTTSNEYLGITPDRKTLIASSIFCRRIGGSCDLTVQALDTESGDVTWFGAFPVNYHFSVSPVISDDGIVFLSASSVYALNATNGETLWEANIDGSSFSATNDGKVLTHSFFRGDLSVLDSNGKVLNNLTLPGVKIFNAVVSIGSNAIYVVGRAGNNTQLAYVDGKTFITSWTFTVPDFAGGNLLVTAQNSLLLVGSELILLE